MRHRRPVSALHRFFVTASIFIVSLALCSAAIFAANDSIAYAASLLKNEPPTPRAKPPAQKITSAPVMGIDQRSIDAVRLAFDAARRGDWASARAAQAQAPDLGAKKLIAWRVTADRGRNPGFAELDAALTDLEGYPRVTDLRTRAEDQIDVSGMTPTARIAWLEKSGPASAGGRASLARAMIDVGRKPEGGALLRKVWREDLLTLDQQRRILSGYGPYLTPDDHVARLNLVLWMRDNASAQMLAPYTNSQAQELAKVRMQLRAGGKKVDQMVAALPASALNDPGLLYDRAQWRKSARGADDHCPLIEQIDGNLAPAAS